MWIPRRAAACAVALFALAGCRGKPLATAELPTGGGTTEVHLTPTGKAIALWSDTTGKWTGGRDLPVHYDIDVVANGATTGHVTCNSQTASTRVCSKQVSINSSHEGNCEVKMSCSLPTLPSGDVVLRVTAKPGPGVSELTHLALVVRQE